MEQLKKSKKKKVDRIPRGVLNAQGYGGGNLKNPNFLVRPNRNLKISAHFMAFNT